jgi:aryl-alcohol dehydrogenase-like predicted oxidoreductase
VEQLKEAQKTVDLVSNQVPYSMVKRDIEKEVVPYCMENNLSILAYSPLQRGLLTGKMKPGYVFAPGDHRAELYFFKNENIKRTNAFLDKIKGLAAEKKATLSQVVLRWTVEQPGITIALVGARDAAQAMENAKAMEIRLSKKEIAFINEELKPLTMVR